MNGPIEDFSDNVSDIDMSDEEQGQSQSVILTGAHAANEEERTWMTKELEQQCREVMDQLRLNKRRWDDSTGSHEVPLLEEYKKTTLAKGRAHDGYAPTTLHILAKDTYKTFSKTPHTIRKKVVRYLLEHIYDCSCDTEQEERGKEELILKIAMTHNNDGFLDCVLDCWPEKIPELLDIQDNDGKNCIHHIFTWQYTLTQKKDGRERFLDRVQKLVPIAEAKTIAAMDKDGNTPIHYAMHYRQCRGRSEKYVETVKEMMRRGDEVMRVSGAINKKGESPIHYCRRTIDEFKVIQKEWREKQAKQNDKEPENRPGTPDMKGLPLRRGPEGKPKPRSNADAVKAVNVKEPPSKSHRTGDFPEKPGLRRSGTGARETNKSNATSPTLLGVPTQMLPPPGRMSQAVSNEDDAKGTGGRKQSKTSQPRNFEKPALDLLEFLTMHYTRTRSDLDARDLIYGNQASGLDRNLYFDALGMKDVDKVIELLDRMAVGGFAETLAYVYLPTVLRVEPRSQSRKKSYGSNQGMADQKSKQENAHPGRDVLVEVFDKLRQLGVRNILRLYVEDREAPSHTDAAIERALRGRESMAPVGECRTNRPISVETWLRKVTVHAAPGLETRERMDNSLRRFETELRQNTSSQLQVKIHHCMEGLLTQLDTIEEATNSAGGPVAEKQHVWVKQMEEFRSALNQIHRLKEINVKRIKVALIDDGVDLGNLDTYNNIVKATGLSYCPPSERGCERPWHRSSTGHGTIMANMIVRLNPWVSLYVMRVQDGASHDAGRTIYAKSAARAIRGAIDLGVNIISMSWTVKQKATSVTGSTRSDDGTGKSTMETAAIGMLQEAIDVAADAKILMFCSASDDIQAGAMDTYPFRQRPGYIFRIGAALALGQRDPHSEDKDKIEYFFPGNQVAEAWNPRSAGTVKYHDGSSVGTALAAGLASLIMYCAAIARQHYADSKSSLSNPYEKLVDALQDRENMKRAFDNIESPHWTDKKYLPVWDVFGPIADKMNQERDGNKKMEELGVLVSDLCSKIRT
ncbi:hypothetical protein QQX98_001572 [Neonectria punicea]|uniref:Peptidase S8/S53 domain-containing protein n=1 Tax=Neonectria punicea TaxID=979145 RepID=A0ABR1HNK6_9HYPO